VSSGNADLRARVRRSYSHVAENPAADHPYRVGRPLALEAGYSKETLDSVPAHSVDAFAGVSCVPCFAILPKAARVLDLGCGAGLDSLLVAGRAGSVVGVDFSPEMLSRARQSAGLLKVTNVDFLEGDAEAIPLEAASVDVTLVNGIFNLNSARQDIFKELARVSRPGGVVFAAELVLKEPLPAEVKLSEADWFS
jgi:arsenite methyltransferase